MDNQNKLKSFVGVIFVVGGIFYFLAGIIHPNPQGGIRSTYHEATTEFLQSSKWPISGWFSMIAFILVIWGIWMLLDSELAKSSLLALAGGRLAILSGVFMIVQSAATIAAVDGASTYASGQSVPIVSFFADLQAVGWPAFTLGLALLALGLRFVHKVVRIIGFIGAIVMGLGGLLTEGFHITAGGPLFTAGALVAFWFIWTGIQMTRSGNKRVSHDVNIPR